MPDLPTTPGAILGYRKNGAPIRLQAGGDPTNDPEGDAPTGKTFTEDEFNKALERERTKLYGRIEKAEAKVSEYDERFKAMTGQLSELDKERQAREKADAKRQKEAEDAARKAQEAELSAKELIERRQAEWEQQRAADQAEWQQRFEAQKAEIAQRDAILQKEREFAELRSYAQDAVAAARDEIAPELIDLIGGNTREEIDASIELMKAKSQQILAAVQGQQIAHRAAMPGVSPAGFTPTGPIDAQGGTKTFTPEEIAGWTAAEYAQHRKLPGMPGSVQQGVGLFG